MSRFTIVARCLTPLLGCVCAMLGVTVAQAEPTEVFKGATFIGPSGKTWTCYAPHKKTGEIVQARGLKVTFFPAASAAIYDGAGWPVIVFNRFVLDRYPPVVELFAYHHECAHLTLPTTDEVLANCEGLLAMRRSGAITPALEEILRDAHYSFAELDLRYERTGHAFWDATVECADLPLLPRR